MKPQLYLLFVSCIYFAPCVAESTLALDGSITAPVCFETHEIKKARVGSTNNTVPNMVWLEDLDNDGFSDLIVSHVSWEKKFIHPYVAWYKGPAMEKEFVIIDRSTVGENSRIYRFVFHDVDGDGRKDLIGQGYQPFHNGNKWYHQPENAAEKWIEYHDYGLDLTNGHDLILWDIDDDGREDLVLLDSHTGAIIVKPIPSSEEADKKWPFYNIVGGDGLTHYMSLFDVNMDGLEDIVLGREEDGGEGIKW